MSFTRRIEDAMVNSTEQLQQAMSSDPTARMAALAAGQHARLGERSPISTLNSDVFHAMAGFVYDGMLKSSVRDRATFHPYPGKDAMGMVNEIIEMRSVLAQRFSIIQARSIVWEGGHKTVSNATSGGPIRYDQEHELSGEYDCGSDDCTISINGITYTFQFSYHGIPRVSVDLLLMADKDRRKIELTGMDSFMILIRLLEQRLTPEDRARTSYDELVPPNGLMYGSEQMRIVRMLKSDGNRSKERHISFVLDTLTFDSVVSDFDAAFCRSVPSDIDADWTQTHTRLITVKGREYTVDMVYETSARDWEDDHACCEVHGIYESDEAYGRSSGQFTDTDAFSAFVNCLAEDM